MTVSSAAEPVRYAELASNTLYGLDKIGPNDFEFSLVSAKPKAPVAEAAPPVVAVPAAKGPVPAIKPFASVAPGGKVTVYPTPAAPVPAPVAKTAAIAVVTPISEDMIATASAAKPDRVALVKLVSDRFDAMTAGDNTRNASAIRSMLEAASKLDRPVANEIIMALRTSIAVKGLGEIRPLGLDVVVQVAPAGQRSGATSANRMIEDKLTRYYNGVMAKSVIGEGISDTDVKGLTDMIRQARVAMDRSEDPAKARALLLLPAYLQNITPAAMQEAAASKDERIKIQFLEQGDRPDLVTQFELGVELIEYARQPEEASQRLLDLIAAMVESDMDPRDILKSFFKNIVIKIRPIDWQTLDEQRKSWEAVAKSL
jgi:hypothetical protein